MAPNLYVAIHTLTTPTQWFHHKGHKSDDSPTASGQPLARTEHWNSPAPGVYRHRPGAGWYLIQLDSDPSLPERPERVLYSEPLHRCILESDYKSRSTTARLPKGCTPASSRSPSPSRKSSIASTPASRRSSRQGTPEPELHFVRHDDRVSWVNDRDIDDKPTHGPWQRFVLDPATREMRIMTKGDDPSRKKSGPTRSLSAWSVQSYDSSSVASSIKAIAPELDCQKPFMSPRSLAASSRSSSRNSIARIGT